MIWGKTYSEKDANRKWKSPVSLWFAWRPVRLQSGRWVWL